MGYKFTWICLVLIINYATQSLTQALNNEMNYEEGINITDPTLIVNTSDAQDVDSETDKRRVISLAKALDIFNTEALSSSLPLLQSSLSQGCKARLAEYIEGLRNNEKWAMKSKLLLYGIILLLSISEETEC